MSVNIADADIQNFANTLSRRGSSWNAVRRNHLLEATINCIRNAIKSKLLQLIN